MFDNIGKKLKGLAIFCTVVGIISALITGFNLGQGNILLGILTAIGGIIVSWLSSLMLYGVGEVNDVAVANSLIEKQTAARIDELERQIRVLQEQQKATRIDRSLGQREDNRPAEASQLPEKKTKIMENAGAVPTNAEISLLGVAAENTDDKKGVRVANVQSGSCCQRAGILPGDIITAINDVEITSVDEFRSRENRWRGRSSLFVKVYREGRATVVTINL